MKNVICAIAVVLGFGFNTQAASGRHSAGNYYDASVEAVAVTQKLMSCPMYAQCIISIPQSYVRLAVHLHGCVDSLKGVYARITGETGKQLTVAAVGIANPASSTARCIRENVKYVEILMPGVTQLSDLEFYQVSYTSVDGSFVRYHSLRNVRSSVVQPQ